MRSFFVVKNHNSAEQFMRRMQILGFYVATKSQNVVWVHFFISSFKAKCERQYNNLFNFGLSVAGVINSFVFTSLHSPTHTQTQRTRFYLEAKSASFCPLHEPRPKHWCTFFDLSFSGAHRCFASFCVPDAAIIKLDFFFQQFIDSSYIHLNACFEF